MIKDEKLNWCIYHGLMFVLAGLLNDMGLETAYMSAGIVAVLGSIFGLMMIFCGSEDD